jgi:hypothetical protein
VGVEEFGREQMRNNIYYIFMLLSLVLLACGEAGYYPQQPSFDCMSDGDCGDSMRCLANRCVDSIGSGEGTVKPVELALRITLADSPASTYIKRSSFVAGEALEDIYVPEPVPVSVSVFYKDKAIEGYAVLSQNSNIEAVSFAQTVALGSADMNLDSRKSVLPGVYTISVYPNNSALRLQMPTVVFNNIYIDQSRKSVELVIGDREKEEQMLRLRGDVFADFDVLGDMKVELKASHRGSQASSATYRLNKSMLKEGYDILLPPQQKGEERVYDVNAKYYLGDHLVVTERLSTETVLVSTPASEEWEEIEGRSFNLSKLSKMSYPIRVVSDNGKSVKNAVITVDAVSKDKEHLIKFSASAMEQSDASGRAKIDLPVFGEDYLIDYHFTVAFENQDEYASTQVVVENGLPKELEIVVGYKKELKGIVYGRDNDSVVANARVIASPLKNALGRLEAYTDEKGEFSLRVHDSEYDVSIVPPANSSYPPGFFRMNSGSAVDGTVALILGKSSLVFGHCFKHDGTTLTNAQIDVFLIEDEQIGVLTTTATDDDGMYRAYIPLMDSIMPSVMLRHY